jgi:metal-sulfur cluster biosynthetic enzyme
VSAQPQPSGPISVGSSSAEILPQTTVEEAWAALSGVYDPELYLDVVSLGLVYDVRDQEGTMVVEMTLTTPGCPASESLPEMAAVAIEERLGAATAVEVRVVWEPPWSPAMLREDAAGVLGFRLR